SGEQAPYFNATQAAQLQHKAALAGARHAATGVLAAQAYDARAASGARIALILVARSYRRAPPRVTAHLATGSGEMVANYATVQSTLNRLHFILLLLIAAVMVLGLLFGTPLVATAVRPLTRMTAIARRIAHGDLTQRMRLPHGGDEIGQLADTFDEMIGR